jgi:hypothetical protein
MQVLSVPDPWTFPHVDWRDQNWPGGKIDLYSLRDDQWLEQSLGALAYLFTEDIENKLAIK